MKLSDIQIQAIRQWLAQGASISDVQKRLADEFNVNMTYMDVRFLLDDIDAQLQDAPEPEKKTSVDAEPVAPAQETSQADVPETSLPEQAPEPTAENASQAGGVQVSVSPIQRLGTIAGGEVVFSDGEKAEWFVDQMGRLSLSAKTQGYSPSQNDIMEFQTKLQAMFR